MGLYAVNLYRSPGRRPVQSKLFNADGWEQAVREAERRVDLMLSRRRTPKFRFTYKVEAIPAGGAPRVVVAWRRCGTVRSETCQRPERAS